MQYYLDIETTGFDPEKDEIITIQYQKLDFEGKPEGDLIILRSWESNEEDIVKKFYKTFMTANVWDFVPIMANHIFDLSFLFSKFKKYGLKCTSLSEYLYKKPIIDIKYTLIMANKMQFKGSGLDQMTNKKTDGRDIPGWFKNREYNKIENYINQETESFIEFLQKLLDTLKNVKE